MSRRETVALRGMRIHTRVGILPHEREHAQPLEVDLAVTRAVETARDALDYRELHALVSALVAPDGVHLLETTAHAIADAARALPGVVHVRVTLRKPHVALAGPLEAAEVTVEDVRDP